MTYTSCRFSGTTSQAPGLNNVQRKSSTSEGLLDQIPSVTSASLSGWSTSIGVLFPSMRSSCVPFTACYQDPADLRAGLTELMGRQRIFNESSTLSLMLNSLHTQSRASRYESWLMPHTQSWAPFCSSFTTEFCDELL